MLQKQEAFFFDDVAPPAPAFRHTFTVRPSGGSGNTRGYNRPGGFGALVDGTSGDYTTPSGRAVVVQHCRFVRSILNFAVSPQSIPVADFPARIVLANDDNNRIITVVRPASVSNISGNTITRADYTVAPARDQVTRDGFAVQTNLNTVLVNGEDTVVELYDT